MKTTVATANRFTGLVAFSMLVGVLAGCGGGSGAGSGRPAPTVSLTVNPTAITIGQSATLAWSSNPGTTCVASGPWNGTKPAISSAEVTPDDVGTVTYTLTCAGDAFKGSSTSSVTLTVDPASIYTATSLVEDFTGGAAATMDARLVNPWGIALGPTTAVAVANNGSDTATLYDGNGQASTLMVQFDASGDTASFEPTGVVFNDEGLLEFDSPNFLLTGVDAAHPGPAALIFAGEGGKVAGWTPAVDDRPITVYEAQDGAVYKGLTLASNGQGLFLYASDFANGKIDVFDAVFAKQQPTATKFAFDDPALPDGYAPFGIQAIDGDVDGTTRIYVSYAMRDPEEPDDDAPGQGFGIVNVFDTDGNLLEHLVAEGGKLNSPWGMALAPGDFGTLSHALLVGNFGDGTIHGYDPSTGRYLGAVTDSTGTPFALPGLWGIAFGNDAVNQPHATLFFAAGTNDETDGILGRIDLGEAVPALGTPPAVTLTVPEGALSGAVTLTADVSDDLAITSVRFLLNESTLIGTVTSTPAVMLWDTTTVSNGDVNLRAIATDDNGNVGSSPIVPISIAND